MVTKLGCMIKPFRAGFPRRPSSVSLPYSIFFFGVLFFITVSTDSVEHCIYGK